MISPKIAPVVTLTTATTVTTTIAIIVIDIIAAITIVIGFATNRVAIFLHFVSCYYFDPQSYCY